MITNIQPDSGKSCSSAADLPEVGTKVLTIATGGVDDMIRNMFTNAMSKDSIEDNVTWIRCVLTCGHGNSRHHEVVKAGRDDGVHSVWSLMERWLLHLCEFNVPVSNYIDNKSFHPRERTRARSFS